MYGFDIPLHVLIKKLLPCFVYFPIIYLQVSKMKAIIFILVATTILSACDGCPLNLRNNWCHCACSDMYSSCRSYCPQISWWYGVCMSQCRKLFSLCIRNCRRKQGWLRNGLISYKEKRQPKKIQWCNFQ